MALAVFLLLATTGAHCYALGEASFTTSSLHEYLTQDHIGCDAPDVSPGEGHRAVRVSWADNNAAKALALLDIEGDYMETGSGCQDGHKSFLSTDGGVQRLLWYSDAYQDWNFNAGSQARPGEVVAFGSDESVEWGMQSPESVTQWFLVREMGLMTSLEDLYTEARGLRVESIAPGMAVQ